MATEEKNENLEQTDAPETPKTEEKQYTYATNKDVDFSGAGEVVRSAVEKKTEETPLQETKKESYQFPHQLLLKQIGITEKDVDSKTKDYVGDFNDFLKHVKMAKASAEKKGKEYKLPEVKKNKLIRLSKSVCQSLQDYIDEKKQEHRQVAQKEQHKKEEEQRRRNFLRKKREEEMEKRKEEEDKKKKEEDDTLGFWF